VPEIIITGAFANYTYRVYDQSNTTIVGTGVASSETLTIGSTENLVNSGILHIEVETNHRCVSTERSQVPVTVVHPAPPAVDDTLYCLDDIAIPLHADTLQIQVIVIGLPDTVEAISPPVCPGQYPTIVIPETMEDHTYRVYSESGTLLETVEGSGDTLKITLSEAVYESTTYFVETVNIHNCASGSRTSVRTEVVNYMYLMPDKIPQYQRNKNYSFQLISNAVSPYEFSTDDMLPFGFSLSTSGLITGTPPKNELIEPVPFLVKVSDINGCFAEKEYVLESSMFIPQAFTPNGDNKNDVFMKNRRLVIFDRLGLKIYEGNDGWDGTRFDGTPAPPDTYFYLIYYEDENLMTEGRKKGYITLMRK
jgi:gliding motility-associated-like protein